MYKKTALLIIASMFFATACEREGPAERAGEAVDDAMDEVSARAEETCEEMADAVDARDVDCG